jgi:hypothetical protein
MKTITQILGLPASLLAVACFSGALAPSAQAGDIFLTGHDVDFHAGQRGFDITVLNYLSGGPSASYKIAVIGTANSGNASWSTGGSYRGTSSGQVVASPAGYGTTTFYDAQAFAALAPATRATILSGVGALVVLSQDACGGCSLTTAGSAALNSVAGDIATAFNAGMDIYGNTGANNPTYYGFLPASALATGASISGSTGFTPTAAGTGIGLTSSMVNGDPTHNRFVTAASAFTVFETRGSEIISIGLKDGIITPPDGGGGGGITTRVPDTGWTVALLGMALPGMAFLRRKLNRVSFAR